MQELEIEKRFLVPEHKVEQIKSQIIPDSKSIINDVYIPNDGIYKNLRLRQKDDKYMITRKQPTKDNDFTITLETTIELSKYEFDILSTSIDSNIRKERYRVDVSGWKGDLDVFTGRHAGLVILEFEFQNKASLADFEQNINLGFIDITNLEWLACGYLAEIDSETLKQKIAKLKQTITPKI